MTSPTERSIPELFGDAMAQLAKLVGNEFALARAEMSEKAEQVGRAAAMMANRIAGLTHPGSREGLRPRLIRVLLSGDGCARVAIL